MSRRNKIIVVTAVIVALLILAFFALAPLLKKTPQPGQNTDVNAPLNEGLGTARDIVSGSAQPVIYTKEPSTQAVLFALAMTFAEKYGSWSSHGNFENLKDAKFYMTDRMKAWADNVIAEGAPEDGGGFYGVTTRALKPELLTLNEDETRAQILVTTQQEEFTGSVSSSGKITYKRLLLDFQKVNDEWKVDVAEWQEP